jgi:hypothetical protein
VACQGRECCWHVGAVWGRSPSHHLKLSSSRGGGIQEGQAPEAIEESMMLMTSKLRARSLSADR